MVLTYLTLLILFVGPMGLGWYLEGIEPGAIALAPSGWRRSRSPARSRPRSACRCTPAASRAGRGQTHARRARRPGPCWRAFGLPVWAIFLAIYPPALPASSLAHLPGLPLAMVEGGGLGLMRSASGAQARPRSRRRRSGRPLGQRPVVEIPHPVRAADNSARRGGSRSGPRLPAADEDLDLKFASISVLPALFSDRKSSTTNTSGENGPAWPSRSWSDA